MKNYKYLLSLFMLTVLSLCGKSKSNSSTTVVDNVNETVETNNGITYKLFVSASGATNFKGILVMGSGNNEELDPQLYNQMVTWMY